MANGGSPRTRIKKRGLSLKEKMVGEGWGAQRRIKRKKKIIENHSLTRELRGQSWERRHLQTSPEGGCDKRLQESEKDVLVTKAGERREPRALHVKLGCVKPVVRMD